MSRRLPPLKAVRAFEAAARHAGFAAAAEELAVTPSAISQQVKILEDWLGRPLFERHARGLTPTTAALRYLPELTEALDRIERASREAASDGAARTLTVTCLSSFGAQWLTPRLYRFSARHPDIDVMLATFDRVVDLEREPVDIAIRYGTADFPGLHVEELMREWIGVVCSPDLRDHPVHPIRSYADLAHHTLLHDADGRTGDPLTWGGFLKRVGAPAFEAERGPRFSDSHMMGQACLAGRGVMLGRSVLVADALANGTLVAPFGMPVESPMFYRMVMRRAALKDSRVAAFRAWIYEELGRDPPLPPEAGAQDRRLE
jgi:LysR family glycine cleavage system transcriptional activator